MNRRGSIIAVVASMMLLLGACGSEAVEQAQVATATPTAIPTTAPVLLPTPTPTPVPAPTPEATATPLPTAPPTALPTAPPTATVAPTLPPTAVPDAALPAAVPGATPVEVIQTPTPIPTAIPTATVEQLAAEQDDSGSGSEAAPVEENPTAVVTASGEPPLECFDSEVQVYRGFVEGVDVLSFEGGRVYCAGAGTNAVSVSGGYRHSSGLVVQRNGDYIFNDAGTGYIPYSGSMHFCTNGQPASVTVRADTVPALLVVIDNEAQRQLALGASGPITFTGSGSQC